MVPAVAVSVKTNAATAASRRTFANFIARSTGLNIARTAALLA
jgi:hypothetical protein